jgi:hypothetical protein
MTTTSTSTSLPLDSLIEQLAPLIVLLFVPLLVLYGRNYFRQFAVHMLAVASSALPWNWSSIYEHGSVSPEVNKKLPIRTRAEQLAARTDGRSGGMYTSNLFISVRALAEYTPKLSPHGTSEGEKGLFYSGLVNISGTYCFMNSTMQVRQPRHPMPAISPQ